MQLLRFKTLWGHPGTPEQAAALAVAAGFDGLEAPLPQAGAARDDLAGALHGHGLRWIQEICTAGSYVPRRDASVAEHLEDFETQLRDGRALGAEFANVMGGCDAWPLDDSVRFFAEAHGIAERLGVTASFETHRGRSFFNPWTTVAVLDRVPTLPVTCDFSHWAVVCERLPDSEWDCIERVAEQALHVHARVGYDQGPQVPHPGAPEYAGALASHQRCWEAVWQAQRRRGLPQTTLTPEFGPDGYLHTLPFTDAPVADLWDLNRWIGDCQQRHFHRWRAAAAGRDQVA